MTGAYRQRSIQATIAALLATVSIAVAAQSLMRDSAADTIDFSDRSPGDLELKLPPAPSSENLVAFDPGRRTSMSYFVDAASVSVGSDGVVRFTTVVKGDGNAQNVLYEGMRCRTRERKVFAHAQADGTWKAWRDASWSKIGLPAVEGYRFVLYQDFFCPARTIIGSAAEGVHALRRGGHPRLSEETRSTPLPR